MFHAVVRAFPVAVIGLFLLVTTACGGVENEPNLAKAVEQTQAAGSVRFEINAHGTENERPLELSCEGAADYAEKRFRLLCDEGQRGGWEMETIVIGNDTYVRGTGALGFDSEGRWWKDSTGANDSLADFSPEKLLDMLRAASRQTERVGEEDVRGEQTVRYRLTVSCEEAELSCPGTETAPVEVWIDGDGLVRRIWVQDSDLAGTIEFFDFGAGVDIKAPPADQVAEFGDIGSGLGTTCGPDAASPINESQALEALRRHGLGLDRDGSGYCPPNVAAVLENAPENFDREGYVSCFLYEKPPDGAPKTVVRRGVDGGDAELVLANLTCMILADSPRAEEKIRPLEQAFEELERAIRP
jgi:hypothetical protein